MKEGFEETTILKEVKLSFLKERVIEYLIYENPGLTIKEIAESLKMNYKTAQRYLRKLRSQRKIVAKLEGDENVQRFYPNPSVKRDENIVQIKLLLKTLKGE